MFLVSRTLRKSRRTVRPSTAALRNMAMMRDVDMIKQHLQESSEVPGSSLRDLFNHQFKVTIHPQKGHNSPPQMGHFEDPGTGVYGYHDFIHH